MKKTFQKNLREIRKFGPKLFWHQEIYLALLLTVTRKTK